MKSKFKFVISILLFLVVVAVTALYLGTHDVAVMNPKGMIAMKQRKLIIQASLLMFIIVIPVLILTWVFAWKYREGNEKSKYTPDWSHNYLLEFIWWGVPFVIVIFLAIITWTSSHELNPFKPIDSNKKTLTIQVVSLDWKWLFIYPEQGIATVNFVQFPEKTPILFEITSDAPMNSFWIPRLGGQIYAMPGMRTKLNLIADETGEFRGASSNISGKGFAGMFFTAKSSTEQEFNRFVQSVRRSSKRLDMKTYNQLVVPSEYNPVAYYTLGQKGLFDQIIMKYMEPAK